MSLMDAIYEWLYGEPYRKPSVEIDDQVSPKLKEAVHSYRNEATQFSAVLRRLSTHPDPLAELIRRISEEEPDNV